MGNAENIIHHGRQIGSPGVQKGRLLCLPKIPVYLYAETNGGLQDMLSLAFVLRLLKHKALPKSKMPREG